MCRCLTSRSVPCRCRWYSCHVQRKFHFRTLRCGTDSFQKTDQTPSSDLKEEKEGCCIPDDSYWSTLLFQQQNQTLQDKWANQSKVKIRRGRCSSSREAVREEQQIWWNGQRLLPFLMLFYLNSYTELILTNSFQAPEVTVTDSQNASLGVMLLCCAPLFLQLFVKHVIFAPIWAPRPHFNTWEQTVFTETSRTALPG